jgi:hypothetical protein
MPRTFRILAARLEPTYLEEYREIVAASLGEALTMAERADAGAADYSYGIHPDHYPDAIAEGIAFNQADGLLLDPPA